MKITEYVAVHAAKNPEHPALIDGELVISYGNLVREYLRWANVMAAEGLHAGDRLGIALRDNSDFIIAVLAATEMGLTVLPIDWRTPAEQRQAIAGRFGATAVLSHRPGQAGDICRTITIDTDWRSRVAAATSTCKTQDHHDGADGNFVIKLSSGTTGEPKGAVVTHSDFIFRLMRNLLSIGSLAEMRYLSAMPLCFSGAFNFCFLHLLLGNTVIIYPPLFSAEEIVEAFSRYKADFAFLPPTVLRWLLQLPEQQGYLLPDLRVLLTSSSPITEAEKNALVARVNPNFYECYSTSAAGQIACFRPGLTPDKAGSVGKINKMIHAEVVDDSGRVLPAGEIGHLRCRGPGISQQYYDGEARNGAGERIENGWCYTGDLTRFDTDGFLYFHGRADDLIIRGGVNIYPKLIEDTLAAHPLVTEAAVAGRESAEYGQEVVAFVKTAAKVSEADLITHCLQKLPASSLPVDIYFLQEFPRTAAGKVCKPELLSRFGSASTAA